MNPLDANCLISTQTTNLYHSREYLDSLENINTSYLIEERLLNYIRHGQVEELLNFFNHLPAYTAGSVASDPLRLYKNYFISITTLATRTLIDVGISREVAYSLSDTYISHM